MDTDVMAKLQAYINTLDMQKLQKAQADVECFGLLQNEEDENPYAELYEEWF